MCLLLVKEGSQQCYLRKWQKIIPLPSFYCVARFQLNVYLLKYKAHFCILYYYVYVYYLSQQISRLGSNSIELLYLYQPLRGSSIL